MLVVGITALDILLSILYIVLILFIVNLTKSKNSEPSGKYLIPFVLSKIAFAILFVLIHSYYYKGGDTFLYFAGANFFRDQLIENPGNFLNLYFSSYENLRNLVYGDNYQIVRFFRSNDVFYMSKIVSIFSFVSFKQYLASNILFTCVTSIGLWRLYTTLCKLYPSLYKYFAIGILFYPSLGIWGSGILKDPITLSCVGFIFSAFYNIIQRKKLISSALLIIVSIFLCQVLKPYILYTFVPVILLWTQGKVSESVKNNFLKAMISVVLLVVFVGGGALFIQSVSESAGKYSIENVQSVAEGFNSWHSHLAETRDQSGYSLGNVEFTATGVLQKSPQAFFVTYYRPFIIGDVRNVATLFEAVQTFILLLLTLYIMVKVNVFKFFKLIFTNVDVRAFMIFAITFGIAIGLTSYNFGALSRYKIPSLPFFTASLAIIYHIGYLSKKKVTRPQR